MNRTSGVSLIRFLLLTFGVSWAFFIPAAAMRTPAITPFQYVLVFVGTIAPSLVALWLSHRTDGESGARNLLERVTRWSVGARWYVFAAIFMVSIKLTAALILRATTGAWPRFGTEPLFLIPFLIAVSTPVQAGEEIGWRGYALPRLAARFGLGPASLVLGVVWALWHLPLFFLHGADTYGQSFLMYLLQVTALSVTMAWLYARTGSLLLVMLFHAAVNNSKDVVPSAMPIAPGTFSLSASPVGWLTVALLWIAAIGFLVRMPKAEASKLT